MEQESIDASPSLLGDLAGRLGLDVPALLYLFTFLAGMLYFYFPYKLIHCDLYVALNAVYLVSK